MKEALYFMARGARVPLDSISVDPPTSYMGETPYVYPGETAFGMPEYASGQADPAIEERFNQWMDAFMSEPAARQQGETSVLIQAERAGTIDDFGRRKLKFIRAMSGEAPVPELTKQEVSSARPVEEMTVTGERKSGLAIFLAVLGLGGVAMIAGGKSRGR